MNRFFVPAASLALVSLAAGCNDSDFDFDSFFERQDRGTEQNYAALSRSVSLDTSGATLVAGDFDSEDFTADVDIDTNVLDDLEGFRLNNTATDIDFSDDDGDTEINDAGDFYNVSIDDVGTQQSFGRVGDPDSLGLAYHTYGAWFEVDGADMGDMVAVVTGEPTAAIDVPVVGAATYTGQSTGIYANEANAAPVITNSNVSATADFGAGTVDFATTDTRSLAGAGMDMPGLDATGTLAIAGNLAGGAITTTSGLTGDADGVFAGPSAEEFGGTLYAGDADEAYVAGFGTRRP